MNATQIAELKDRIVRTHAAVKANFSAHNAAIVNRAHADLLEATGEVFSNGVFVNPGMHTYRVEFDDETHVLVSAIGPDGAQEVAIEQHEAMGMSFGAIVSIRRVR